MGYVNLSECLRELEATRRLVRLREPVDANIEAGVIQRRAYRKGGPAILFENVKGCTFPMVGNLFGTSERIRYIFRDTLRSLEALMSLKADPAALLKKPLRFSGVPLALLHTMPKTVSTGPIMARTTRLSELPQLRSWPMDGGAYVTLPQVYTEDPDAPGYARSNLGMYRVQLSGETFAPDREVGLHYQIHRGIGPHHAAAIRRGERLPVNVFVGGPPAMTLAAVMPLPEGMPEIFFAGVLGGRRVRMVRPEGGLPVLAEADFCIQGYIEPHAVKPEGPFGDHLGYYSLAHDFPVMTVTRVLHRENAVWPFTTVGRPPQEDTVFGEFIHDLTGALVPTVFSGVREVHAVDAAGVHPLLLAVGSERYVPYAAERQPQELLTSACALLGTTQTSLSKYVIIAAAEDSGLLSAHKIPHFLAHVLERIDLSRDLHFLTRTTMDTLDYSGISLNQGSKVIIAAAGAPRRELSSELPRDFALPEPFGEARVFSAGIVIVQGPPHGAGRDRHDPRLQSLAKALGETSGMEGLPLVVVCDDAAFTAADWDNFLWVTFTRSDPATDIYGGKSFTHCKHWGCAGPLVIDARLKTYHAPPLDPDPVVEARVDALAAPGGALHGVID
ncbi:UbiD family decarboxylase [Alkalidesulfovibrio alkalitolerans DSM 16529]|uniref:UbiD family decarboxylase n=1 Tax=Alkalidesulfovibrio alkalitolerans DSM 16529 TaxID=1121439 RepID=S7SZU0_9BACT|nr:UbiD family decarboxylase [Alkalidesulfovibrio alkalitolerans]EPR30332.1 UbiD family decarboxylase [Alkalidesulfovibrio alkalitolerans DSM 16529]